MTNKEALEKSYNVLSPYSDKQRWEFDNNLVHMKFVTENIPKFSQILDIGCGIGILDMALCFLGYKVCGVDKYVFEDNNSFSVNDINSLAKIWSDNGLNISQKDILKEDVGHRYGAVISVATIEHQLAPKKFLERILFHLNVGGIVYVATPNISHFLNRARFLFGKHPSSAHLKNFFDRGELYEGHWREYTLEELRLMFEWIDIEIIKLFNIQSMKPNFSIRSLRDIYVNIFRILSYVVPSSRDTNIIIGRKK